MPAFRMCQGVTKSGSPMPKEITSSIVAAISNSFRMPEGGRFTNFGFSREVGENED